MLADSRLVMEYNLVAAGIVSSVVSEMWCEVYGSVQLLDDNGRWQYKAGLYGCCAAFTHNHKSP